MKYNRLTVAEYPNKHVSKVDNILGLDIGNTRIGVALANSLARIPSPLTILNNNSDVFDNLKTIIKENEINLVVIGLPRNMKGEETAQSVVSRDFAAKLTAVVDVTVVFADESLSSKRAEQQYPHKKHLDDIAACFILEEHLKGYK